MKPNYTHITLILDRSGSMADIRDDVIDGFNFFLKDQQAQPGEATLTFVQFDTEAPYEVLLSFRPLAEVKPLTKQGFKPRGGTPLLDALGRGLNDLDTQLAALPEAERPEQIVFAVLTDGLENSSREFTAKKIRSLIEERKAKEWQFVFLSASLEALGESEELAFDRDSSALFSKEADAQNSTLHSMRMFSRSTAEYRKKVKKKLDLAESEPNSDTNKDNVPVN